MGKPNSDTEQGGCLRFGVALGGYGMVLVMNILSLSAIYVALVLWLPTAQPSLHFRARAPATVA